MMTDLLEVEWAASDPTLISFSEDGVEGLHHADAEVAGRHHEKDAVLEALDVISRVLEFF